ncbi:MAG: acyl-CoA dehydrogenase family protein [Pseudomonadales bacterium]|jgi:3-hydroxy-9,10-secoandrosta-1,3,5(10)-triene-9,17-dione monooxygenase|nr:acyl-CoA dehydrogenase family protein [Pseudomonadales bacterium]
MSSRAELLAKAAALIPVLRERAQHCEELRRVPDETIADFEAAGFYKISQPLEYGGYELSPLTLFEVAMALSKGCPSSGWCLCLIGVHNWEMGLLDPQIAEDLWSLDSSARVSSSYAPFGQAVKVDGGYQVTGRWPWSSGCDHCTWVNVGVRGQDLPPLSVLIPRSDYEIDDTWFVAGLKGTGSKDIVVDAAFVPEHRIHNSRLSFLMQDPGRAYFTAACYRYPFGVVFGYCLASVTQGIAEGALEVAEDMMRNKLHAYDGSKSSEDPFVLQRLANAKHRIELNRHAIVDAFSQMDAALADSGTLSIELRVELKWRLQRLAHDNAASVTDLMKAGGGAAMRLDNPLQRYFRDIHTATNHAFLNVDKGAMSMGSVQLAGGDAVRDKMI